MAWHGRPDRRHSTLQSLPPHVVVRHTNRKTRSRNATPARQPACPGGGGQTWEMQHQSRRPCCGCAPAAWWYIHRRGGKASRRKESAVLVLYPLRLVAVRGGGCDGFVCLGLRRVGCPTLPPCVFHVFGLPRSTSGIRWNPRLDWAVLCCSFRHRRCRRAGLCFGSSATATGSWLSGLISCCLLPAACCQALSPGFLVPTPAIVSRAASLSCYTAGPRWSRSGLLAAPPGKGEAGLFRRGASGLTGRA